MKLSKKWIIAILILVIALAGIATVRFIRMQQIEQAKVELQQREARERKTAIDVVRSVHKAFFAELNKASSDRTGMDELLATSASKNITDSLVKSLKQDQTLTGSLIGCRSYLSDILLEKGFIYETPIKVKGSMYRVPTVWKKDMNDSRDKSSRGYVELDVASRKITSFDCKEQDAVDAAYEASVDKERSAERAER